MKPDQKNPVGAFCTRVEYPTTEIVTCEMREGVAMFVFSAKEHNRRVVAPADEYLAFLENLRASADEADG